MKYLNLADGRIHSSQIILGCMRIHQKSDKEVEQLISVARDEGINYFDHADIYGNGKSEELFGNFLRNHLDERDKIYIQTKCGICKGDFTTYDFSKEYIIKAVEGSLKRLQTDYIDTLLLHRPDALMEADEVAAAFEQLHRQGKVRHFGVSNITVMQFKYLQKSIQQKLVFNQMKLNPVHAGMIDQALNTNMKNSESFDHDGSILDYCRLQDVTVQAWSILQAEGTGTFFIDHPDYAGLTAVLRKLGDQYHVSSTAIVAAWILRHPAKIQPIVGTTNPKHLKEICRAADITLTRKEWYEIYLAPGRKLP